MSKATWDSPGVLLAIVLGVHVVAGFTSSLPAIHPGGDNSAYIALAHSLAGNQGYSSLWHPGAPPHTQYPPVYPGVLALLILAGAKSWTAFKLFSLVTTASATAFCFLWVRKLHGPRIAAVTALLFGLAPGVLISAQWILAEPLFMTFLFASLWLLTPETDSPRQRTGSGEASPVRPRVVLAAGLLLVIAAYFTRSAGLPLVVALVAGLTLARRWVALGAFAALFAITVVPWHLRAGEEYIGAFWMVNPYAPDLGRADLSELVQRVLENLWMYATDILPTSLAGVGGTLGLYLGLVLAGLAVWGWILRIRERVGVHEIFFVLYAGLIFAWPSVWSGDRFLLPIIPSILLYAGEALGTLLAGVPRWRPRVFAVAAAAILLPAAASWLERAEEAAECRVGVLASGPMGCYQAAMIEMQAMALWTRERLPEGSVVFVRKPRLFHAFSGHAAVVYPFSNEEGRFLAEADSIGVDYVVLGNWDRTGSAYVLPAIQADRNRFCLVAQLRTGSEPPVSLLAIRRPGTEDPPTLSDTGDGVAGCLHEDWDTNPPSSAIASMVIPILSQG